MPAPTVADYAGAGGDTLSYFANPANANNYVNALYDRIKKAQDDQTMQQAGQQYATGNNGVAATTLANSGNIPEAQKIQDAGQAANSAGMQALIKAYPIFKGVADQTAAGGPQAQSQALRHALALYAPELKATTGMSDQVIASIDQSFATDPQGTLARFQAMIPIEHRTVGEDVVGIQGNTVTPEYQGSKYTSVAPGGTLVQTGGAASSPPPTPSGAATPAQAPVQSGTNPFAGPADPATVAKIESNDNPNAVNPQSGAEGLYQTKPSTLTNPGFGVQPAQPGPNGQISPQEKARVGRDYLGAMGQHEDNNLVYQLAAQDWGPGKVDQWIKNGAHVEQLPLETRNYIIKYALARLTGAQPPQARAQMEAQSAPQAQGGARVVYQGGPVWRAPTPDEQKQYPGAVQINANGEVKYPPVAEIPLDPSQQTSIATQIANYQIPPLSSFALKTPQGVAIMSEVTKINPGYQAQNYNKYNAGYKAFSTGKQGDTVRSLNTWVQHAQVLTDAAQALGNQNVQLFNRISNWWRENTGSNLPTDFRGIANIYNDEGVKAILGTGGALGDREKFDQAMSSASSPAQIAGITRRYVQLATGQLNSYRIQYQNATGRKDFDTLLAPETIRVLEQHKGALPTTRGTAPTKYTPAQQSALKKNGLAP
jgi:hypothetical protein